MRILSIETSCDDTCIAIVEAFAKGKPRFKVLSNVVSSQVEVHKKWGGVFPSLAKREHQRNLVPILVRVLKETRSLNLKVKSNPMGSRKRQQEAKVQLKSQNLNDILKT
jgi:N6-L-threonylcarbamoyladenine synthase